MKTVADIVSRALRLGGWVNPGSDVPEGEMASGIEALNGLLKGLATTEQGLYRTFSETFDLVADTGSYAIGLGEAFDTVLPYKITSAYVSSADIDYPLSIENLRDYDLIANKTITGIPAQLYFDRGPVTGTILLFTVPALNTYDLTIRSVKPLVDYVSGTETLGLPDEYEQMLPFNLAVDLHGEFGGQLSPIVIQRARETLSMLKRIHLQPTQRIDVNPIHSRDNFDIVRGY